MTGFSTRAIRAATRAPRVEQRPNAAPVGLEDIEALIEDGARGPFAARAATSTTTSPFGVAGSATA